MMTTWTRIDLATPERSQRRSATVRLLLTAEQAAEALAIGRTRVYDLMRSGELESVRIGSSRRIPISAIRRYIRALQEQSGLTDAESATEQSCQRRGVE